MAKGARASTHKSNNSKLKSRVFGPVETARTERLSAKLLELASQPKPKNEDVSMQTEVPRGNLETAPALQLKQTEDMEVDKDITASKSKLGKGRIEKRRSTRKATIVFQKYKAGKKGGKSKGKK